MEILSIFALLNMGGAELLLIMLMIVPTIFAVINIAINDFEGNQKILWLLIAIFVPFGVYIYFIFGWKKRIKSV
jgi:Phospholipase_D-nuclease N-terminal